MTLAQKRMAAMIMETTAEDVEAHRARQAAAEAEAAAAVSSAGVALEDAAMEESDDEDTEAQDRRKREEEERVREVERARAIQANSLDAGAPMKIRTDYVPKCEWSSQSCMPNSFSLIIMDSRQEDQRENDHMHHLWSADPRGRTSGTHAY